MRLGLLVALLGVAACPGVAARRASDVERQTCERCDVRRLQSTTSATRSGCRARRRPASSRSTRPPPRSSSRLARATRLVGRTRIRQVARRRALAVPDLGPGAAAERGGGARREAGSRPAVRVAGQSRRRTALSRGGHRDRGVQGRPHRAVRSRSRACSAAWSATPRAARASRIRCMRTLDSVRARSRDRCRGRRVVLPTWDQPLIVIGGGSFLSELVTIAGGRNVYDFVRRAVADGHVRGCRAARSRRPCSWAPSAPATCAATRNGARCRPYATAAFSSSTPALVAAPRRATRRGRRLARAPAAPGAGAPVMRTAHWLLLLVAIAARGRGRRIGSGAVDLDPIGKRARALRPRRPDRRVRRARAAAAPRRARRARRRGARA